MLQHHNNLSLLRLLFAALVILAHAPELIDGSRSREIAYSIWGTVTLGTLAVDGFFLVSGYLIAQSFENSRSILDYLQKRVLRIYPAFLVASAACVLVVAPLGGAAQLNLGWNALRAFVLAAPITPGIFTGLPYPVPNGPMWTIAYEFRCYILIALLGVTGLLRHRAFILASALACLGSTGLQVVPATDFLVPLIGQMDETVRLTGMFLVGTTFYLFRDRVEYRGWAASIGLGLMCAALFWSPLAEFAVGTVGAYAMFWLAFRAPARLGSWITEDISYGLYLYAWPVMSLLYYYQVTSDPWLAAAVTLAAAGLLGWLSWRLIERPALSLKKMRHRSEVAGSA